MLSMHQGIVQTACAFDAIKVTRATLAGSRNGSVLSVRKELPSGDRLLLEVSRNGFLNTMTSSCVITRLRSIFTLRGTPEVVFSDNGPQFQQVTGSEFHRFAQEWGFEHKTSSTIYLQSNGFVEVAVGMIKKTLKKTSDSYIALQSYCATLVPPSCLWVAS